MEHTVTKKESHVFENIGDAILNAFTKVKKPDPKYMAIREKNDKFEQNLVNIEKVHSKLLKTQSGIFFGNY